MDSGTTVYKAYIPFSCGAEHSSVWEGTVTEAVLNGVPLVRLYSTLQPLDDTWHVRRIDAERDIHRALIRQIGSLQAKADAMAANILHADLTTEAA